MKDYKIRHYNLRYYATVNELYDKNSTVDITDSIRIAVMDEAERQISGSSEPINEYVITNRDKLIYDTFRGYMKLYLNNVYIPVDERYLNRLKLLNPNYEYTRSIHSGYVYRFTVNDKHDTFITLIIEEHDLG